MTDFDRALGTVVQQERKARGFSRDHLAARCRIEAGVITEIEHGSRSVSLQELVSLTDALETSPEVLLRAVRKGLE